MTDFPGGVVTPLFISTFSPFAAAWNRTHITGQPVPVAVTWPTANMAYYVPVYLPFPYIVRRVFWVNGSSVTSTNRDFGIFDGTSGVKLYSTGSTAAAGASLPQYVDATDFLLPPGTYYFGISCSSITASRGTEGYASATAASIGALRITGLLQEASALPLPATMTPAVISGTVVYPMCGITSTSTGFA